MRTTRAKSETQPPEASTAPDRSPAARILQAQDEERRKIGRELHDSVGQALVAIKMSIAKLKKGRAIENDSVLDEVLSALDSTIAEVRTISHLLHPPDLDLMGLRASLAWYVQGFKQRTGIETDLDAPDELPVLSPSANTVLLRVAQESLTNIHKQASQASLRLAIGSNELQLEVADNGKGFADLGACRQGVGILGMQERVAELGGTLRIESGPDAGSSVLVTIPLLAETQPSLPCQSVPKDGAIRVLVVDDHPAIRDAVRTVLAAEPDMIACGEACNAAQAIELAGKLRPNVVILDLQLGDVNGWTVVRELHAKNSPAKIVIFSHFDERYAGASAYRGGCNGFVSKSTDTIELTDAIPIVHGGGSYFRYKPVGQST